MIAMPRRVRSPVLLTACASFGRLSSVMSAVGSQQVFRAGVDLVTFGVTVTDRKGNLVTDLAQEDFEIVEDGRPQALQYFARGDGETSRRPCTSA